MLVIKKKVSPATILFLLSVCIFFHQNLNAQNAQKTNTPQLGKNSIKEVIAAMTLEEKAKFLVGNGFKMPGAPTDRPTVGQTKDKVAGAAGTTFAIPRLGIPSMVVADGPAGVRIDSIRDNDHSKTYYATAWPVGTLLASSWDTSIVKKVGAAFGSEVKEYGVDILLGPGMNIHRNPLGGRNFEYYSEDPLVSGYMAAALVKGIQSNGVGTSIKHFVANNQETDRNSVNTIVSERAMREIYLKGFEIAVKQAKPWTVMSSYNYLNGVYASESNDLLTTILRKDWGYKGFVMTDWFGGKDPVAQMKAGNNLLMPGTPNQTQAIMAAVKNGSLDEKILDENIAGILNILLHSPAFAKYHFSNQPNLGKDAKLSRMAASEGMVLLKNEGNSLPLSKNTHTIGLFGNNGYELIAGGTGSGDVNKAYKISPAQGFANAGYQLDEVLNSNYLNYLAAEKAKQPKKSFIEEFINPTPPIAQNNLDNDLIAQVASRADVGIFVIGRNAGEGSDRKLPGDYYLNDAEKSLIQKVSDAFHAVNKKLVVVLNIGGVVDVLEWRDKTDAILLAWQPGQEGGNAIIDVLSGKVNPSGKLATSFPAAYTEVPSAKNFPGKEFPEKAVTGMMGMKIVPAEVVYEEGIYVGYRYYQTYHVNTAYDFGFGLSYTQFSYSHFNLSSQNFTGKITASVTITNTGKVAGKEVAELYVSAPGKSMDKPAEELKGFAKTRLLLPGQSQTLTFTLNAGDLSSFDTKSEAWVAESGTYTVKIGSSASQILGTKSFTLGKEMVAQKVHEALKPQVEINEWKPGNQ